MKALNRATRLALVFGLIVTVAGCGGAEDRKLTYLQRAEEFVKAKNHDKARVEYKNALQIDPKDASAHYGLGQVLESLKDWSGAAGQDLAAIESDPAHISARIHLGQLYLAGGVVDRASEQADKSIVLAPNNPDGYALRGAVKARQKDYPAAMQDAETGLRLDPGHINSIALIAAVHHGQSSLS